MIPVIFSSFAWGKKSEIPAEFSGVQLKASMYHSVLSLSADFAWHGPLIAKEAEKPTATV